MDAAEPTAQGAAGRPDACRLLKAIGEQYRATIEKAPDDWRLRWDYGKLLAEDLKAVRRGGRPSTGSCRSFCRIRTCRHDALGRGASGQGRPRGRDRRVHEGTGHQADRRRRLLPPRLVPPEAGQDGLGRGLLSQGDPVRAGLCARLPRLGRVALQTRAVPGGREGLPGGHWPWCRIMRCCTAISACCCSRWAGGRKGRRRFARRSKLDPNSRKFAEWPRSSSAPAQPAVVGSVHC